MKKYFVPFALAAVVSVAAAQAQFKVDGFLRGGFYGEAESETYSASVWQGGEYFGGVSRLRINLNYTTDNGGVTFRYQKNDLGDREFFKPGNIRWAQAYANLLDGLVIAEGGLLVDKYTSTGGWEDFSFGDNKGLGARIVVHPIEGLYVSAGATDYWTELYTANDDNVKDGKATVRDVKIDERIVTFSAKYKTDAFYVAGGYGLAGVAYGGLGVTAVDGLNVVAEVWYEGAWQDKKDYEDPTKAKAYKLGNKYDEKDGYTQLVLLAEYTGVENLSLALLGHYNIADDDFYFAGNNQWWITPAVSYNISELLTVSLEGTYYAWDSDVKDVKLHDDYFTVTPAVTFLAGKRASATLWATISSDKGEEYSKGGIGVRYNF